MAHCSCKGDKFVKAIQSKLKDARIECLKAPADELTSDILRALRAIILKEKGNSILANVSVGSKIQAIAVQRYGYDKALLCGT
jgi:hypothetical protein